MSISEKMPAFQFYPKDWFSDLKVKALTYEQKGIYIELLAHSWLEPLSADTDELARIFNINSDIMSEILERFFVKKDDSFINLKLENYRDEKIKYLKKLSNAGKKGNAKRWKTGNTKAKTKTSPPDNEPITTPSPSNPSSTSTSSSSSTSNIKNNISKDILEKKDLSPKQKMLNFIQSVIKQDQDYFNLVQFIVENKKISNILVQQEINKFHKYWTEKTLSGKKQKWQLEKTFEVQRRLTTWFNNNYGKIQSSSDFDPLKANIS